jgi:hypothetical protein
MSDNRNKGSESFLVWAPDFYRWPESWMGTEADLAWGRKLLPWFSGFLQALYAEGMVEKTFAHYRDNLWLLGGSIVREVSLYDEYRADPFEKLAGSVADEGILPDHYDQMSRTELRAFERMCRRFEKYLREAGLRSSNG